MLLVDVAIDGAELGSSLDFITDYASSVADERRRARGAARHALADGRRARSSSSRWASPPRSTSRSTPTASAGATALIEVNIQNLAAVPSIVYGILGLAFLVRGPLGAGQRRAGRRPHARPAGAAGRDHRRPRGIRAVPPSIREGSMALGATQWQTIWRQVLPAAIPGIATGVILALSRAIGETAPLIVVGAATFVAFDPDLFSQFTALPIQIFDWISRPSNDVNDFAVAGRRRDHRADGPAARHERGGDLAPQSLRAEVVGDQRWLSR